MQPRDERLLDAAIDVLGTAGIRALTHRSVDVAAGLPEGSTSNRFRTRQSLLAGILRRTLEREMQVWTAVAADLEARDLDSVADALGRLVRRLSDEERVLSRARHLVFLEPGTDAAVAGEIARGRSELASWMAPLLRRLGSTDPVRHVGHLLALIDGLLASELVVPRSAPEPGPAITALLRGLLPPTTTRGRRPSPA